MSERPITAQDDDAIVGGSHDEANPPRARRRKLLFWLPIAALLPIGVVFYLGLWRDPHLVPSPLIGKPVPEFSLPPVKGHTLGLSSADLRGHVSLVNFFASWCVACRQEHPLLLQLKQANRVVLDGVDYKDPPADAQRWLQRMGDPYGRIGADLNGRVAINWGVYGVPETYVVDSTGRIAFKQIGPITQEVLDRKIMPLVARLQGNGGRNAR